MWEAFKDLLFVCIEGIYTFIGDWGLAIIIATLIFRLALFPLMQKQIRSSFMMQKMSPLIQEIKNKYADDQNRQAMEMQKLQAETGFNPLAGCLPMLLQMPIFIALFQVFFEMVNRVSDQSSYSFFTIIPNLLATPANAWAAGMMAFLPYAILLLTFAFATFIPTILQTRHTNNPNQNQTYIMMAIMTLMMLWIGWGSPAGVLLFWAVSSVFMVCQQVIYTSILRRRDREAQAIAAANKPVEIDVTRKVKKKRPTKKK